VRTSANVALQGTAAYAAIVLRVSNPGWTVIIAILFVVPLIVCLLPLVLALATQRRRRLEWCVALPFVASAIALVALAALYPEEDDQDGWVPAAEMLGMPRPDHMAAAYTAGDAALLIYLATLVWTGLAIVRTTAPPTRPRWVPSPDTFGLP
jgi:hypothetical protein